jgi:Bacterial Ig domain
LLKVRNVKLHKATATNNQSVDMGRIVILAVLLTISILVGTVVIGVADANPFGLDRQMDAPSDAKPPIISILSPENNTSYSGSFNISFSVKEPQYFSSTVIANVWYTIDNTTVSIPYEHWTLTQGPGVSQYSTSIIAPTLPEGNHSLKIRAQGGSYDFYNFFLIDGYSQVYFTVSENSTNQSSHTPQPTTSKSSTPLPAASTPTQTPSTNEPTGLLLNQQTLLTVAAGIIILAVGSITLAYIKKHTQNARPKNGKTS